jgi:putative nucleotidyltransferase with HDIG domain
MPEKVLNSAISTQQVTLAVARLESLSTSACTAAQFLPKLMQEHFQPSSIIDIIEADPALVCMAMSMLARKGINLADYRFSLGHALDKMPPDEVRNTLLSIKIGQPDKQGGEAENQIHKGLLLHSLAVGCCSRSLAEKASPKMDPQLAYYAGLLHDIGKFALEETMPKSFELLSRQAESMQRSFDSVEQENLGTDHTIIGKQLSQKWQLPSLVTLAVWLHCSQSMIISRELPEARIAVLVQLADAIVRQLNIGWSGSFSKPPELQPLAQALAIEPQQLQLICKNLPELVAGKTKSLALDMPQSQQRYCRTIQNIAVDLAHKSTLLNEEIRKQRSTASHIEFIKNFLPGINSTTPAINIAQMLAEHWQKFYQTGKVCLYLAPSSGLQGLAAVVVQNLSQSSIISLAAPVDNVIIPREIAGNFAILNAYENIDWLFEQLEVHFDGGQTKLVPLLSAGRAVGAIAFELHYPCDSEMVEESFRTFTSMAGAILALAMESDKGQRYSERLARLISPTEERGTIDEGQKKRDEGRGTRDETRETSDERRAASDELDALAEMAAGAAHELNNPLAVIVGRAQLLAETEDNEQKKRDMEQIYENANKASEIIEDLMSFAQPTPPRSERISVAEIIEEAVQLAGQKINKESLDIKIDLAYDVDSVFVDSAQIVSALANIITNAVESYHDNPGPVKITASLDKTSALVKLTVIDEGCGMDSQTLRKAIQPFYSAQPAGRKRGMGLSYAARLIQINNGSLNIQSKPASGTMVNIYLPFK